MPHTAHERVAARRRRDDRTSACEGGGRLLGVACHDSRRENNRPVWSGDLCRGQERVRLEDCELSPLHDANLALGERSVLESELIGEYQRVGRFVDAEALLRRRMKAEGAHPYPQIALALHFQYFDVDLSKALRYIAPAVKKACSSREFGYLALGVQARLAIKSERWKLLARSLTSLTEYRHRTGNADVFPETDFLSRIPEGRVSPQVVAKCVRRVNYLRRIGYSTLTGRSTRTRARSARAR